MLIEMHAHTQEHSSCSRVSAVDLVRRVYSKNLQGIVLTDHHYQWSDDELRRLRRAAKVPDYFLILSGQEIRTPDLGDVLVYGATRILEEGTALKQIREEFPDAALVWAHPYRSGKKPSEKDLSHPAIDAIEIFNSNQTVRENSWGLRDWHRLRFTAVAGTDTHGGSYAGIYPTLFDHPIGSVSELASEIQKGHCHPFLKEIPKAGTQNQVTEITFGTKGDDEIRERIIIKTLDTPHKWQSAERAHHIMDIIGRHGFNQGPFRVPHAIDEDTISSTLIQQGLRGKSLFDKLIKSPPSEGRNYIQMAAQWLARLHNARLRITPLEEFWEKEEMRLDSYLKRFRDKEHPHTKRAEEIMETLEKKEKRLFENRKELFIQGHGDFHPKNIIIGQDQLEDTATCYVAAIDFESSLCLPPAFDVGYFLAQFRNQFFGHPQIIESYPDKLFLNAYMEKSVFLDEDFSTQVELFKARANLNIAAYLIKVGMGNSEDLWRVMIEAEQELSVVEGHEQIRKKT